MTRKLSIRLGLFFVAIAVISIVLVAFVSTYFVNRRFDEYVAANEDARNAQVAETLARAYSAQGGWTPELVHQIPHWSRMMGIRLRIVTRDGQEVIDTAPTMEEGTASEANDLQSVVPIVTPKQRFVAIAYVSRLGQDKTLLDQDILFRRSTNESLVISGVVAALIALVLSFFVSARLVYPIRALTTAAKAMEQGNLNHRVEATGGDEVAELGKAFNQMADALHEQQQLRKNMTADMAHELRTPLATIQSQIEAFQDGVMEPDAKNLASIHEETIRLARLVGDLRELSEAEGGKLTLHSQPADLAEFAGESLAALEPRFIEEGVTLEKQLASSGRMVLLDRDKMRQVLLNLVSNALKFTPRGGWVRVTVASEAAYETLTVADNGAGISGSDLPYIFERFFRADRSRNRAMGGAGIGLAITKELVEAHGGRITVTSVEGQGSSFVVRLPVARA
ncbi:MAG: HAMP domain-containing protein [Actinobacteria bacterium]|nr:MAG: HAMP domain-containing protein [Actinomycetota bacterium]